MAYVINRGTKDHPNWYAKYKDQDGRWKQRSTGQATKASALAWAREVEARIRRGLVGVPEPNPEEQAQKSLTVGDLCLRYLAEYSRPKIKDLKNYLRAVGSDLRPMILNFKGAPIGSVVAVNLRRLDVERWRDALYRAGYCPGSVNRGLGRLNRVYTWAMERDILPPFRSPCAGVEHMPSTPSEEHYSLDEVHRLLAHPDCPPIVWAALYTGMRKGELFGLSWSCVRLDVPIPYIDVRHSYQGTTKNGKARAVPIHPELLPILRTWREQCPQTDDHLVFPVKSARGFRMGASHDMLGLPELLLAAGVHLPLERSASPGHQKKDRAFHTCRHTFATLLLEASGNEDAVSKMLGHSHGGTVTRITKGYTHTGLAYLARELQKLSLTPTAIPGITSLDQARRNRAVVGA